MSRGMEQVVVTPARHAIQAVPSTAVHHREFPEVNGEGDSAEHAALQLADRLVRTLDCAPSDWRREQLCHAIEDVRAFAGCGQVKREANPDK